MQCRPSTLLPTQCLLFLSCSARFLKEAFPDFPNGNRPLTASPSLWPGSIAAVSHFYVGLVDRCPPAPPLDLCSLVAVCVSTATLQSPSRDPCKSVWDVSVTCFTPGGVPACKGIVLVRENKSHGTIRRHFGGSWHHSVGYLNVNLLNFTRNSSHLCSQE